MLTAQNLNIYYGRKEVIKNASFTISPGEIVGLIGANGAGKTTIMKTILGLTKFTGKVSFNNQKITLNNHSALQSVGALIENPAIYPFLTGRANLELYSKDHDDMVRLIAQLGMNNYIDKKAKDYSIGMKQKLGIALALLDKPKLVILDEPMNGLDIEATILIRKLIHVYAKNGTSFLISSHVLSELKKVMTSVIIINHGEIVMNSPMEHLIQNNSTKLKLQTINISQTIDLLNQAKIPFENYNEFLIINNNDLSKVQEILVKKENWITALTPSGLTFEQTIVNILQEKQEEQA